MKRWLALMAVICTIVLAGSGVIAPCWGDTLISFTDTKPNDYVIGILYGIIDSNYLQQDLSTSWTQTVATTNTTIGAILTGVAGSSAQGQAYLMNALGPGTTMANQIAMASFTPPILTTGPGDLTSAPVTTLFTGLNLAPGTYYLVLQQTAPTLLWYGDDSGVVVNTAAGFSVGTYQCAIPLASYPPSSSFLPYGLEGDHFFYTVEGTVVPVPPTVWLLGSGLLGLAGWRRFRKG